MSNIPFRHFGTMIDVSRNAVLTVDAVKKWIDISSDLGYNSLMLYSEDTYEIPGHPYFGHFRGRYSQMELRELDSYALDHGVELIPCIQTLAHLNAIMRWPQYRKIQDFGPILLAEDEGTYELIDAMFASLAETFTTRLVHIGMDEAHMVGLGKYLQLHGLKDRHEILVKHLARVAEIAKKYGFETIMWGDMFFRIATGGEYYSDKINVTDEIRAMIPDNVRLVYWDYYSTDRKRYEKMLEAHNRIKDKSWFAGGLWTWTGFAPHNRYSIEATKAAIEACRNEGVQDVFLTLWGDDGGEGSVFSLLPALYYAAKCAEGETSRAAIEESFEKKYGIPFKQFMLLDLPGTDNAPAGVRSRKDLKIYNAEKYMFYNDVFMGTMDSTTHEGGAAEYASAARKLSRVKKDPEWGYLFTALQALCEVLAVKYDLGIRTRKAYAAMDREELYRLVRDYKKLEKKLGVFYEAYKSEWMREKKPHGFDVQEIRMGGLALRVKECRKTLEAYLAGKLSRIEELDEPNLDLRGGGLEMAGEPVYYNQWGSIVTANVISHG